MKQLIVVGGGGFSREVIQYLLADRAAGRLAGVELAGVVDDRADCEVVRAGLPLPYLGTVADLEGRAPASFVLAIGSVRWRAALAERLLAKGHRPFTYVHPSVVVAADATIGRGALVCPNSIVNSGAVIGEFAAVNVFCSIGHGAQVGAYSVISPYAALNGDACIGQRCFLGTRATVFPGVTLGDGCIVDSHSFAKVDASARKIISVRGQMLVVDNRLGT